MTEEVLGTRDTEVREPDTFALFLKRARSIGFSNAEIERLRETYGHSNLEIGNADRGGGEGD